MNIVFMGTPQFAVESLKILLSSNHIIVCVVTTPDKPAGRGLLLKESNVKNFCKNINIPILQPTSLKDENFIKQLIDYNADVFVVVAFRMLPEAIWKIPPKGTINLHASLLPDYRGAAPINWAIINGEKITGVTTFFIEKEIDTGNIIDFTEVEIKETDNAETLHDRLMITGSKLLLKTIDLIDTGNFETQQQKQFIINENTLKKAPKLNKDICYINWKSNVISIYNKIRGLSPYPCSWAYLKNTVTGEKNILKIYRAEIIESSEFHEPYKIISDGKTYMYITANDGLISLLDVKPEGKNKMQIKDFLNGIKNINNFEIN